MRRVWFKKEMREAILEGKKIATTRDHVLPLEEVLAVSGSRFKAEPFAILRVHTRLPMQKENVIQMFFEEEGFNSSEEMIAYAKKNRLLETNDTVYFHKFDLIKKLKEK